MAAFSRFGFLAAAMIFHLVYIYSIFDIYFVSPIVTGMRLHGIERTPPVKAPADRLVLFVGDGLRADKAFQSFPEPYPETEADLTPRPLAPFIRSKVLNDGTFGVSHTRVPTESRPGHVALIAGLYEDVSAVATGWKMNPVHFDSVFNRSRHTWSWGSPDIVPMFEAGAVPGRVDAYSYEAELEDFSKDATALDYWVFDHVRDFFAEAATNKELDKALRQDKIVFFLHLLGIDTTGHSYRPYSKEYLHNIKVVDQGVKEMTELIDKFYADDRTAYIFTADHGMSDWGSHGDGHPDNTRTPLVAWGSGVARPEKHTNTVAPGHDEFSADWGFDHVRRHDVAQADIAALMAYLTGLDFPANSVGELPLSFLAGTNKEKAQASLVNAQSILEMYRVKEAKKMTTELRFRPYSPFSEENTSPDQRIDAIKALIESQKYEEAIEETDALIQVTLQGLRYLQTYDWLFLRALITIGYLGWMAYAITTVVELFVVGQKFKPQRSAIGLVFFSSVLVTLYASFVISQSSITYYLYAIFPVVFWEEVFASRRSLAEGRKILFASIKSASAMLSFGLYVIVYVGVIEGLALGYIHREVFTGLYVLGALWPLLYGISFLRNHATLCATWTLSCLVMSTFTLLPANKTDNIPLILAGGVSMVIIGVLYLSFEDTVLSDFTKPSASSESLSNPLSRTLMGAQIGLTILAMIVTRSSALSLAAKTGLPLGNQVVGWTVLVLSLLMPFAHRLQPNNNYMHRLMLIFLTCSPTFVILTISYEGLFYVAFCITLVAWVRLEYCVEISGRSSSAAEAQIERDGMQFRALRLSDARIALFFLALLQSAFFSTGNVASISSFSLDSVNRLLPVFDPFSQGALLIFKLMVPFALISANLGVLNIRLGVAPSALFMIVMAISDVLTLYFFWVVKDEGSWLEIGSTISHFAIASLLCVFVAALEAVSALFVAGVQVDDQVRPQEQVAEASGKTASSNGSAAAKKSSKNKN
ncbi:phosphatidylinositolglycan class N [Beauveria bassiana ARSEF 2860]|uniref:GPI ethanolamine phosphate transferase 1 n=1 Tax=Beauveria bassiana (strain ARSEF 2860) TaxID=655819 RepID=J5J7I8_BEAB2|nr:phosphatidylinositolglycan class N [Beauveria bassiana ARSEF 2860]EJP62388.1 phosphatidylinositolglycan class N [Beauveria bassiana ARSEF 2860]